MLTKNEFRYVTLRMNDTGKIVQARSCGNGWTTADGGHIHRTKAKMIERHVVKLNAEEKVKNDENDHNNPRQSTVRAEHPGV